MSAKERVLVTGANGFIASHIVNDLLKEGKVLVRGTVRNPKNPKKTKFLKELKGAEERLELVALDLLKSSPEEFKAVVEGCDYVLHTASPFPMNSPKDENELIKPAVEGTLGVLKACEGVKSVKRVVVTSSCVAIAYGHLGEIKEKYNEDTWTEVKNLRPDEAYTKSKTLAERAAWDFMKEKKRHFTLTTVNPSLVIGPSVSPNPGTSLDIIKMIMTKGFPMLPNMSIGLVDVRDVSLSHILAMRSAEAAGKRIVNSAEELSFADMAETLQKEFTPMGYTPTSSKMPYALVWVGAIFSGQMRSMKLSWGKPFNVDGSNVTKILGVKYRDARQAVIEAGHTLVDHSVVEKKKGYVPLSGKKTEAKTEN
eukprot:CAMPEP_0167752608 /NCGR_PEP_ID=MMETSP0110_2-20121227/7235_1 /TAXON_ID=629695 /ORGANISM="Gymnochlora sp., Strain CCMP2014" /LENGTH=366 /DNA_ID=CAMNT_0007638247 /DNA_START=94 /DNA_END=1194 /DNA_ORIENTATION=-